MTAAGPVHSFQRLQIELANLIAETPPGDRLPSEPELASKLKVSRATLREAMRSFEGQGVIRRRQGVGTFVVSHTHVIDSGLEILESIETMAKKIELDVSMGDLTIKIITANDEQAEKLKVESGTCLVYVSRVIKAEERPVACLVDILPEHILSEEELQEGFTGSVLDFLLTRGSPALVNSITEIKAVAASSETARSLEIQRGDVLLSFVSQLCAANGEIVDYSTSYFLPGYFRFNLVRRVESSNLTSNY